MCRLPRRRRRRRRRSHAPNQMSHVIFWERCGRALRARKGASASDSQRELFAAAGGAGWRQTDGWRAAAAGAATDYCSFYGARCSAEGCLTFLCVPPKRRFMKHRRLTHRPVSHVQATRCERSERRHSVEPGLSAAPERAEPGKQRAERRRPVFARQPVTIRALVRSLFAAAITPCADANPRRWLHSNALSGGVPSSFGSLTQLRLLCVIPRGSEAHARSHTRSCCSQVPRRQRTVRRHARCAAPARRWQPARLRLRLLSFPLHTFH